MTLHLARATAAPAVPANMRCSHHAPHHVNHQHHARHAVIPPKAGIYWLCCYVVQS